MDALREMLYISLAAAVGIVVWKLGLGTIASWNVPFISQIAQAFAEVFSIV